MKKLLVLALMAALVGSVTTTTAKADREGRALVGGLIGGLIIGSVLDNDHRHHSRVDIHYGSRYGRGESSCCGGGHYDYVSMRTWVSGGWSFHYDHCGRRVREWVPGHYDYRKQRVWVDHGRDCRHYRNPGYGHQRGRGHSRRR